MRCPLPLVLLLALAACAQPTTQRPGFTAQELESERALEQRAAMDNPFPPIVEPVYPTKKMKNRLQAVASRVSPQATKLCYAMYGIRQDPDKTCNYTLAIKGTRGINASADGQDVLITAPMMMFAAKDTQLAFVLSHELAHNIMEHQAAQSSNGLLGKLAGALADGATSVNGRSNGGFGDLGEELASRSYSTDFEQEADYIGLYILARAGYPIEQAPDFWRAMSQYDPQGIYARSSHPTNPERFVAMNKTIAEIRAKQRAGQPLIPNTRRHDS